jgi:peptidoglycan/LPS O-acetylase OafA/YrhL
MTGDETKTSWSVRRLGIVPAFDGVRGVAVLLVIGYHFRHLLDPWTVHYVRVRSLIHLPGGAVEQHTRFVLALRIHPKPFFGSLVPRGGSLGVDMFFVLSGFLITALLLREHSTVGNISLRGFYRRRALRLLPALFFFLAAQLTYALITNVDWKLERAALVAFIFYFWNWRLFFTYPEVPKGLAHLWSLSVEEQFYMVWPLVVVAFVVRRRRAAAVIGVMAACVVAIALWRVALAERERLLLLYFRTDVRADALLVGALAAYLWTRGWIPPRRVLVPAAWLALVFVTGCVFRLDSADRFLFNGGFTLIAISVAIIILAIVEAGWLAGVLTWRPLRALGRVSYGLYLWHFFVFMMVSQQMSQFSSLTRIVTAFVITVTATLFSWFVIERPFLRRKNRSPAVPAPADL